MFIHQDADTEWQILNRATDIGSWYGFVTEPIRVFYKSCQQNSVQIIYQNFELRATKQSRRFHKGFQKN